MSFWRNPWVHRALGLALGGVFLYAAPGMGDPNFAETVVLLVDQDIEALIELIRDLPEPAVLGPLWPAIKYALLGYLERIRDKPADEKKRYARKPREVALSLSYYGGAFLGILQGFIWDGLISTYLLTRVLI